METKQDKETFRYTYSAKQQEEVQNIRKKYAAPEEDKMEQLRRLDMGVTKKASGVSIIIGVIGALILGFGMSLIMTDIGAAIGLNNSASLAAGSIVGIGGLAMVGTAYPIYNCVLRREREKIAPEILRLTDELMK